MFNKTSVLPNTLNEQYNSGYFDKNEYITRLAIDMIMDDSELLFTHEDLNVNDFDYSRRDLIDETMHKEDPLEALNDLCAFKNVEQLRTEYLNFLIEEAGVYIEQKLNDGYQVEVN